MKQKKQFENLQFRKAESADVDIIWSIILQAKQQMKSFGSCQWDDEYPSIEDIRNDIILGEGYVIEEKVDRIILAYGVVSFKGEPVYDQIYDLWSNNLTYLVVHRLAVADGYKHHGIAALFMQNAEQVAKTRGVYDFRVDTKYDNHFMLNLLDKLGFHYCGEVIYRKTEVRKAFEKFIHSDVLTVLFDDYTLREATFGDAVPLFEAIDENRKDLRVWLSFVDQLHHVEDLQICLESVLAVPYVERNVLYLIEKNNHLCGLIGFFSSDWINKRAEIGYWLLPEFRGKGIVSHALKWLSNKAFIDRKLNRLQIRCACDNLESNKVAMRAGFQLEGIEREGELLVDDQFVNMNVYSLLKSDSK